eukprot:4462693-Pleurochrysis_carterae.AAC.1
MAVVTLTNFQKVRCRGEKPAPAMCDGFWTACMLANAGCGKQAWAGVGAAAWAVGFAGWASGAIALMRERERGACVHAVVSSSK